MFTSNLYWARRYWSCLDRRPRPHEVVSFYLYAAFYTRYERLLNGEY